MPKLDQIQSILKKASGVSAVNWWPKYIYHYTDLTNAIGILKECKIFSRNSVGELANENASKDVIEHTSVEVLDYVRFYFRPKTPTQYRNEGFIPRNQRWSNAHVPIPIFIAFKADKMFEREDVLFSEVSLIDNIIAILALIISIVSMWMNKCQHKENLHLNEMLGEIQKVQNDQQIFSKNNKIEYHKYPIFV
ncbi:DarT ssDNA thymidine ADP-ribosyltransferase family protein [uncultured Dubosiella sp.]|uniref:DarT ssDNA thymidine ADP-ribosyltransferase family protein n=1 Tax=uncultured Dubosiella sp. TaxID=1937011 RepID=UPI0025F97B54|nr:DarT ssDNA thymidine ADP-ribosyltransferase family protein [uncultured Dubosiella sp.]